MFITVVGSKYFTNKPIFRAGQIIRMTKDIDNEYEDEAIAVELPVIGQVGYVANSTRTVARGTSSAGRIYDAFEKECFGVVRFVLKGDAIVQLIESKDIDVYFGETAVNLDILQKDN